MTLYKNINGTIMKTVAGVEPNPGPRDVMVFRYEYLLIETGTCLIRKLFDDTVGNDLVTYLKKNPGHKKRLNFLLENSIINDDQKKFILPLDKNPDTTKFDISLLLCLLRNICGLKPFRDSVWESPGIDDISVEAELTRLKKCRNEVLHRSSVYIPEPELKKKLSELRTILINLNKFCDVPNLTEMIEDAFTKPLDDKLRKQNDTTLKVWIELENKFEEVINDLKNHQAEIKNVMSDLLCGQSQLKHELADIKNQLFKLSAWKGAYSEINTQSELKGFLSASEDEYSEINHSLSEFKDGLSEPADGLEYLVKNNEDQTTLLQIVQDVQDDQTTLLQNVQDVYKQLIKRLGNMEQASNSNSVTKINYEKETVQHKLLQDVHERNERLKDSNSKMSDAISKLTRSDGKLHEPQKDQIEVIQNVLVQSLREFSKITQIVKNWSKNQILQPEKSKDYNEEADNSNKGTNFNTSDGPQHTVQNTLPPPNLPDDKGNDTLESICNLFMDTAKEKGRLKVLIGEEIEMFRQACTVQLDGGAFGEVYRSDRSIPKLNMKVAMKKIVIEKEIEKMRSVTNEKLASRTMHFGIVPLLMYGSEDHQDRSSFYFITPYMENGSLCAAIENDRETDYKILTLAIRLKILYHTASGIHFLHTEVNKFRGIVCHMDIKTLNIVLDQYYNARLIDFGLAREMDEGSDSAATTITVIPGTKGYFPTDTFQRYTRFSDYYSFCVVILELLTGLKPVFEDGKMLKDKSDNFIKENLETMWIETEGHPLTVATDLIELSKLCHDSYKRNNEKNEEIISSKEIVDIIYGKLYDTGGPVWNIKGIEEALRCNFCMLHDAVSYDELQHDRECKIKVCVSCMKNSYCNPIWCHTCRKEIIPNIGRNWVGMIIAGNDPKEKWAKVFAEDGEKIKAVVTSKHPLVMGISMENLVMVKPECPGKNEKMIPKVKNAFDRVKELLDKIIQGTQKTLFLYFSGHYFTTKGFQLGRSDEYLSLNELQDFLTNTVGSYDDVRIIVLLDCCNPPGILLFPEQQNKIKLIQLNPCKPGESFSTDENGSIFQRLFTQALTGQAFLLKCKDITKSSENCKNCGIKGDFVTVRKLQKFINKHYNTCLIRVDKQPTINELTVGPIDARIGYVVNYSVDMVIVFEWNKINKTINIPPRTFYSIEELKTNLFDKVLRYLPDTEGPQLSTAEFQDILLIYTTEGPDKNKSRHRNELDTIEKVNMAWESRRSLYVTLRNAESAEDRLVGVFSGDMSEIIVDLLKEENTAMSDDKTTIAITVQCDTYLQKIKKYKGQEKLKDAAGDLQEEQHNLKSKKQKEVTKLIVKFPYKEDAVPKYRKDFLCFKLDIDKPDSSE